MLHAQFKRMEKREDACALGSSESIFLSLAICEVYVSTPQKHVRNFQKGDLTPLFILIPSWV